METKKYAKDGTRLTDCCGAYSTFMEASGDMDIEWELTCKGCYETVPYGQGDGSETKLITYWDANGKSITERTR